MDSGCCKPCVWVSHPSQLVRMIDWFIAHPSIDFYENSNTLSCIWKYQCWLVLWGRWVECVTDFGILCDLLVFCTDSAATFYFLVVFSGEFTAFFKKFTVLFRKSQTYHEKGVGVWFGFVRVPSGIASPVWACKLLWIVFGVWLLFIIVFASLSLSRFVCVCGHSVAFYWCAWHNYNLYFLFVGIYIFFCVENPFCLSSMMGKGLPCESTSLRSNFTKPNFS